MRKVCFYLFGICLLTLSVAGCTTQKVKWMCSNVDEGHGKKHCNWVMVSDTTQERSVADDVVKNNVSEGLVHESIAPIPVKDYIAPPVVVKATIPSQVSDKRAYDFGDFKSSTLASKAWQALATNDLDSVLAYTNKCIDMYAEPAAKMQASLTDYPTGDPSKIFSFWAINDVATSLYIQGEALRKAKRNDEAKAAFERIVNEFSYGQTYDVNSKSFWKPVDGAKDSLYMIEHDLDLDFGNMASNYLVLKMWKSLANKNLEEVLGYGQKLEHLYRQQALDMQKVLKDYPALPAENINSNWALNDVGTGMFIVGEAYRTLGNNKEEAIKAYKSVKSDYLYSQCWDPQGWFWKPADAAQQKILELEATK